MPFSHFDGTDLVIISGQFVLFVKFSISCRELLYCSITPLFHSHKFESQPESQGPVS